MERSGATRTELLAVGARAALAERGRDLLVDKRNQLMKEFRRTADRAMAGADALEQAAAEASLRLGTAEALDGPESVRSAALVTTGEVPVTTHMVSIMGVPVPDIERGQVGRPRTGRGYSLLATSARIDDAADAFENEIDLLLDVATREIRLRRLAEEIGRTSRRVNALEHVVIPDLRRRQRRIRLVLDEREREEHFRLRRAKAHRPRSRRVLVSVGGAS